MFNDRDNLMTDVCTAVGIVVISVCGGLCALGLMGIGIYCVGQFLKYVLNLPS